MTTSMPAGKLEIMPAFKRSWELAFGKFWPLLVAWLIAQGAPTAFLAVTGGIAWLLMRGHDIIWLAGALLFFSSGLVALAAISVFSTGWLYVSLRAADQQEVTWRDLLRPTHTIVMTILSLILVSAAFLVGLFLLVVPGIYVLVKLQMTPFFVIDRDLGPVDAARESWRATAGIWWPLFWFDLLFFVLMHVAGALVPAIGAIPVGIAMTVGQAAIYRSRSARAESLETPA